MEKHYSKMRAANFQFLELADSLSISSLTCALNCAEIPVMLSASTIHRTRSVYSGLVLAAMLLLNGCSLTPLAKHTVAFSTATNLVATNSTDAYRTAIKLHELEQAPDFVARFQSDLTLNPYDWKQPKPLITPQGLATRIDILDSLRVYAQSLVLVANGGDRVGLDAAAKPARGNLG